MIKQAKLEKLIALVLFIAVLITFSFAEKESKKIEKLYTKAHQKDGSPLALKITQKSKPH